MIDPNCPTDSLANYSEEYHQQCLDRMLSDIEKADNEQAEWDMRNMGDRFE